MSEKNYIVTYELWDVTEAEGQHDTDEEDMHMVRITMCRYISVNVAELRRHISGVLLLSGSTNKCSILKKEVYL